MSDAKYVQGLRERVRELEERLTKAITLIEGLAEDYEYRSCYDKIMEELAAIKGVTP